VEPSQEVKAAAAGVQESLRRFDWIEQMPLLDATIHIPIPIDDERAGK